MFCHELTLTSYFCNSDSETIVSKSLLKMTFCELVYARAVQEIYFRMMKVVKRLNIHDTQKDKKLV